MPVITRKEQIEALLLADKVCIENGLTGVCDAGLDYPIVDLIDSLQESGLLQTRLTIMLSISDANLVYLLKKSKGIH